MSDLWGLHIAADERYSLPTIWEDYQDWNGPPELGLTDPKKTIQHWGNVQDYLRDRHGIDPYTAKGYKHPASLAMAKLHALAQSKGWMDGLFSAKDIKDDDLLQGAALGLLKIRQNQHTNQIEPDVPDDYHTASTDGIRYAHVVEADVAEDLMRLAMAWQDWAPKIQGGCKSCTHRDDGNGSHGEYWIEHEPTGDPLPGDALADGSLVSNLSFFHDVGRDGVPELYIAGIHTSSGHRNDGVAEALMRRMHEDHPNTRINPGFMTDDGLAFHNRMLQKEPQARGVLAAVTQNLVDQLKKQFDDWAVDNAGPSEDLFGDQHNRGPIGEWRNVENFLADHYPAAHKNHDYGMEEAAWALDGHKPMPYQQGGSADLTPYETGPAAVAQHGYDPAEVAAAMVLLHNQSHPLRGPMAADDQKRLTDIFEKRQKMQRDYEQRQRQPVTARVQYDGYSG